MLGRILIFKITSLFRCVFHSYWDKTVREFNLKIRGTGNFFFFFFFYTNQKFVQR